MNTTNTLRTDVQSALQKASNDEYIEELKKSVTLLGEFNFEDDKWYCSKLHNDATIASRNIIYFHKLPVKVKELVKLYALVDDTKIRTRVQKVWHLVPFFTDYLSSFHTGIPFDKVTREIVVGYENYLIAKPLSDHIRQRRMGSVIDFFNKMSGFPGIPFITFNRSNPFAKKALKSVSKRQPVPQDVARKLDQLMFDLEVDIPLAFRVFYWTIRLFPNRVTEACSIGLDCLTGVFNHYILRIPSWKTNGGHSIPEVKTITLGYHGLTKVYIDLVLKLQQETRELHSNEFITDWLKNYLFVYKYYSLKVEEGKLKTVYHVSNKVSVLKESKANKDLKFICDFLGVEKVTTHQFRHSAVTDRLNKGGYTKEQVTELTLHKSSAMLEQYHHADPQYEKAVFDQVTQGLRNKEEAPLYFNGRIINLDNPAQEKLLSKKLDSHLVGRLKKPGQSIGVCSQVTTNQCNPKGTQIYYECLACDWFIPIADKNEEYKEDYNYWKVISDKSKDDPNQIAKYENATRNMALLQRVIDICEYGIERHREQISQNLQTTPLYNWHQNQ